MQGEPNVKSLTRALTVLECFSTTEPELGVTDIAKKLGMRKSTIYNILSTFQDAGYVIQNPENSKYSLSLKILHLGFVVSSRISLRNQLASTIKEIANLTGEVCYLGMLNDLEVLYLDAAYPSSQASGRNILGERAPLYCTGLGKAMLANLPEAEISQVLASPMTSFTRCTITDPAVLRAELEEIRTNGYAVDNMEHEFGIRCVAVPIFDSSGKVIGAVSASGPSLRFDPDAVVRISRIITDKLQPMQRFL